MPLLQKKRAPPIKRSALRKKGREIELLFGAELGLKLVQEIMQGLHRRRVSGLLALHRGDDHLVAKSQLFHIAVRVGLEALGEEVVENLFLDVLRVGFLIRDPTSELVRIGGRVLAEFDNGLARFLNGHPIGVHGLDDIVVVIDPTRNLAMRAEVGRGEEGEAS